MWVDHVKRGGMDTDLFMRRYKDGEDMVVTTVVVPRRLKRRGDAQV
jgi:hypothetical protein